MTTKDASQILKWWVSFFKEINGAPGSPNEALNVVKKRIRDLEQFIEKYSKRNCEHYSCEDDWYSCPLAPEGCANDEIDQTICNCGADKYKAAMERIMKNDV